MKGAFGNEGALLICVKNMSVGANGLADLEKDSVSRSGAFPTWLFFVQFQQFTV